MQEKAMIMTKFLKSFAKAWSSPALTTVLSFLSDSRSEKIIDVNPIYSRIKYFLQTDICKVIIVRSVVCKM